MKKKRNRGGAEAAEHRGGRTMSGSFLRPPPFSASSAPPRFLFSGTSQ